MCRLLRRPATFPVVKMDESGKRVDVSHAQSLRDKLHFEKVHLQELSQQSDGYGVATILIRTESKVAGQTLSGPGFNERDLMVLSIERDEGAIPVPKAQNKIQVGDRLICYGKLENVKGLV